MCGIQFVGNEMKWSTLCATLCIKIVIVNVLFKHCGQCAVLVTRNSFKCYYRMSVHLSVKLT